MNDRGVIDVSGEDAESFLNRLVTNNVSMAPGAARFAALLSPQGKLLFDFFVLNSDGSFLIDCLREQAADLAKKLTMFKLRAKVVITDRSAELGVAAVWDGVLMEAPGPAFRDPRHNALGYRIVAPLNILVMIFSRPDGSAAYEAHRIACGIPKGGVDFIYGDSFVHDANMDLLHGIDFDKGCYVGQEVVSRVYHRNSARKRVAHLHFYGDVPALGTTVLAETTGLGTLTSVCGHEGLATLRIDRLAEAEAANIPITVDGTLVAVALPSVSIVEPPAYADHLY